MDAGCHGGWLISTRELGPPARPRLPGSSHPLTQPARSHRSQRRQRAQYRDASFAFASAAAGTSCSCFPFPFSSLVQPSLIQELLAQVPAFPVEARAHSFHSRHPH